MKKWYEDWKVTYHPLEENKKKYQFLIELPNARRKIYRIVTNNSGIRYEKIGQLVMLIDCLLTELINK